MRIFEVLFKDVRTSFGLRTLEKHLENPHLSFVQPSKIFGWEHKVGFLLSYKGRLVREPACTDVRFWLRFSTGRCSLTYYNAYYAVFRLYRNIGESDQTFFIIKVGFSLS
jgi:hypothetical protein